MNDLLRRLRPGRVEGPASNGETVDKPAGQPGVPQATARPKLIVGLGNPGREHGHNRHNVGFQCVNHLAKAHGLVFEQRQARAKLAIGTIAGTRLILAKPQTYMNLSGQAVSGLVRWYKLPLSDLLVIYDDLDLPMGTIRLRPSGSAAGHKGMRSIIEHLKTDEFPRLRLGIGRPLDGDDVTYVLSNFTRAEAALLADVFERAVAAIECVLSEGLIAAMNKFN
jgi:PTH1 family peptidyl-tRNA hydrolase